MFFACLSFRFLLSLCRLAALKKVNFQPKGNFRAIALKMPVHICMFVVAFLNWPKKNAKRKCCTYLDIGLRPRLIRSHTLLGAELAMSLAFTIPKLPIESL